MSNPGTEQRPPRILPPHYFALSACLVLISGGLALGHMALGHFRWLGALILLMGVALTLSAASLFAKAKTNIVALTLSSALVTDGIYRFTRNPMYLGMTLALMGIAIMVESGLGLVIGLAFAVFIQLTFIRREEALMRTTFPEGYPEYFQRVRRWI